MNTDLLRDVLTRDSADPDTVMTLLHGKCRRRMRRQLLGITAAVVVLAALTATALDGGRSPDVPAASITTLVTAPPTTGSPGRSAHAGCAQNPLVSYFTEARRLGATVLTAHGTLTGRTKRPDGYRYHEMTLTDVHTLDGPALTEGTRVWIRSQPNPPDFQVETNPGPLWATDGAILAIYYPPGAGGLGPEGYLRQAPLVGDQVIFSVSGCWATIGVEGTPYHGPLTEIPDTHAYQTAATNSMGLTAVPLTTVEQLIAQR